MKKEKSGENISPMHPTSFVQSLRIIEWAGKSFIIQSSPGCLLFGCLNNVMRIPCLAKLSLFFQNSIFIYNFIFFYNFILLFPFHYFSLELMSVKDINISLFYFQTQVGVQIFIYHTYIYFTIIHTRIMYGKHIAMHMYNYLPAVTSLLN